MPARFRRALALAGLIALSGPLRAQSHALDPELLPLAQREAPAVLETLRALTAFDSGTGQAPGLAGVAGVIEKMARDLGGDVRRLQPAGNIAGPNLLVTFKGTGQKRILMIAHMDTVYPAGTAAAKPMRVEGNRAIAPGIADDKSGIAVFLHALKLLKDRGHADWGQLTLLFNSDEERASFGSRDQIRSQAQAHDVVLSGEPTAVNEALVLGTSGVGQVSARVRSGGVFGGGEPRAVEEITDLVLRTREAPAGVPGSRMNWTILRAEEAGPFQRLGAEVQAFTLDFPIRGRASHAGNAPEAGVNAVVEAAALVRRVIEAAARVPDVRVHARTATGGLVINMIPDRALVQIEVALPKAADARLVLDALLAAGQAPLVAGSQIEGRATPGLVQAAASGEVFASADVRVPDAPSFTQLAKAVRDAGERKKHAATNVTLQDSLIFPAYNASDEGRQLAAMVQQIYAQLGGQVTLVPRTYGGTDAAWAAQSGKPVVENLGLPGGNYHSSDDEFVLVDAIPRRVALVAEVLRALSRR